MGQQGARQPSATPRRADVHSINHARYQADRAACSRAVLSREMRCKDITFDNVRSQASGINVPLAQDAAHSAGPAARPLAQREFLAGEGGGPRMLS